MRPLGELLGFVIAGLIALRDVLPPRRPGRAPPTAPEEGEGLACDLGSSDGMGATPCLPEAAAPEGDTPAVWPADALTGPRFPL